MIYFKLIVILGINLNVIIRFYTVILAVLGIAATVFAFVMM